MRKFILLILITFNFVYSQIGLYKTPPLARFIRYYNNQLQFTNDLVNWYNIPTSLTQGGGWTLGLNKIYQTTTNTPVHIRSLGSDTTGTRLLNVYGDAYIKGRVIADSGLVVNWSEPQGVLFDGVDDYYMIVNFDTLFWNNNVSVELMIKYNSTSGIVYIFDYRGYSQGIGLRVNDGILEWVKNDGSLNVYSTGYQLMDKNIYHIVFIKTSNNVKTYVNGFLVYSYTITLPQMITKRPMYMNSYEATGYYNNYIYYLLRVYNRALSQAEVTRLYNNGLPHLAELPYADRNANQTILTSGTLRFGKRYRIDNYVSGDDFTNVGASSNATGIEFVATGTTPTNWTNGSQLRQIGCVAEYKAENAGTMGWIETQNGLHAVSGGNPIAPVGLRDYKSGISTTTVQLVNTQKPQTILRQVVVKNNYAGSNTFFLGTTTNANELLNGVSIAQGETKVFDVNSYSATERNLFCRAGNSNVDVTLIYEKVAR